MNQLNGRKILILDFVSSVMNKKYGFMMGQNFIEREKSLFGYLHMYDSQRILLCFEFTYLA
tara:strand:+ start:552 stop:734 length:183 start_codon:yes stop_codon:yes gene_type:complete